MAGLGIDGADFAVTVSNSASLRVVVGFMLSPLAAIPVSAGFVLLSSLAARHAMPAVSDWGFVSLAIAIAYVSAIVFGSPAYVLLRITGRNSLTAYALAGLAIGIAVFEITWPGGIHGFVSLTLRHGLKSGASLLLHSLDIETPCAVTGLLGASLFWAIVRPDRISHSN